MASILFSLSFSLLFSHEILLFASVFSGNKASTNLRQNWLGRLYWMWKLFSCVSQLMAINVLVASSCTVLSRDHDFLFP